MYSLMRELREKYIFSYLAKSKIVTVIFIYLFWYVLIYKKTKQGTATMLQDTWSQCLEKNCWTIK